METSVVGNTSGSSRHGQMVMILAISSIIFWLVLSDGYDPRLGPATSFYYTMTVHYSQWFCSCPKNGFCLEGVDSMLTDCFEFKLMTKHFVLLSFSLFVYGLMIKKTLVKDPVSTVRKAIAKLRVKKSEPPNDA